MINWPTFTSSLKSPTFISSSQSTLSLGRNLFNNLARSPLYHSLTSLDKSKTWSRFYVDEEDNVQKVLDAVSNDQKVITNPRQNRCRRTVVLVRKADEPFGFTIQSYIVKRCESELPIKITYVDYVHIDCPASIAGIRVGDVIISINGNIVVEIPHTKLIELINSLTEMRMVVVHENVRKRIELIARAIKLRKLLNDKLYQLNLIDIEEQKILNRAYLNSLNTTTTSISSSLSTNAETVESSDVIRNNSFDSEFDDDFTKNDYGGRKKQIYGKNSEEVDSISISSVELQQASDTSRSQKEIVLSLRASRINIIGYNHVIKLDEV